MVRWEDQEFSFGYSKLKISTTFPSGDVKWAEGKKKFRVQIKGLNWTFGSFSIQMLFKNMGL